MQYSRKIIKRDPVNFIGQLSTLFGKQSDSLVEYKRFKRAMDQNSHDQVLKIQFIKFCLLNRFIKHEIKENHVAEALGMFETLQDSDTFDLQCHYLVGKYYQEDKDNRKAYQVYLNAIRRFNEYVGENPDLKSDNVELAYSIALNLMTLQANPVDPELEKCFKIIRKSFPMHLKRIEYENEMAKPAPDKARIQQLAEEIRKLKAQEEKEIPGSASVKDGSPASSKTGEKEDIFTRLFRVPVPVGKELDELTKDDNRMRKLMSEKNDQDEFLKISPVTEFSDPKSSFMVFRNDKWEGPFNLSQLRAMGNLDPGSWVCRVGSQLVNQAYEVPDLHSLIK